MRPQKDSDDQQPYQLWNSEAARKSRYADDEREDNRELCQVGQGQGVRPENIKPFHRPFSTSDRAALRRRRILPPRVSDGESGNLPHRGTESCCASQQKQAADESYGSRAALLIAHLRALHASGVPS